MVVKKGAGRSLGWLKRCSQIRGDHTKSVRPELVEGLSFDSVRRMPFWTCMLHCAGGAYYVSHTDDLDRRMSEHELGAIPGFTHDRLPVKLVWAERFDQRIEALAMERRLKGWS